MMAIGIAIDMAAEPYWAVAVLHALALQIPQKVWLSFARTDAQPFRAVARSSWQYRVTWLVAKLNEEAKEEEIKSSTNGFLWSILKENPLISTI